MRETYYKLLGPSGVLRLGEIWERSNQVGHEMFNRNHRRFYSDDFAAFTDLAAIALKLDHLQQLKRFVFVPLRSSALNAGAKYDALRDLDVVFLWSSLYHAINLAADQQAVEAHCKEGIQTHPLYHLYMAGYSTVLAGIYYFGLPYLGHRKAPGTMAALPDDVGRLSWFFRRQAVNFVLLHELGHIFLSHTREKRGMERYNTELHHARELAADAWAVSAFDTTRLPAPVPELALAFQCVFDVLLQVELFDNRYAARRPGTHPLSTVRIEKVLSSLIERTDSGTEEWGWLNHYLERVRKRHKTTDYAAAGRAFADITGLGQAVRRSLELREEFARCETLDATVNLCDRLTSAERNILMYRHSANLYGHLRREKAILAASEGDDSYREHLFVQSLDNRLIAKFELVKGEWGIVDDEDPIATQLKEGGLLVEKWPSEVLRRLDDLGAGTRFTVTAERDQEFAQICASGGGSPFVAFSAFS